MLLRLMFPLLSVLGLFALGCSQPEPEIVNVPVTVEVDREIPVTVVVEREVEITRRVDVPVTVEVEREVPVTVVVEREVEVTRNVEVPATVEVEVTREIPVTVETEVVREIVREVPVTVVVDKPVEVEVVREVVVTVEVPQKIIEVEATREVEVEVTRQVVVERETELEVEVTRVVEVPLDASYDDVGEEIQTTFDVDGDGGITLREVCGLFADREFTAAAMFWIFGLREEWQRADDDESSNLHRFTSRWTNRELCDWANEFDE